METKQIVELFKGKRLNLDTEVYLQAEIQKLLITHSIEFIKEYELSKASRIDFLIGDDIGVEVKIKGSPIKIYEQCVRYCSYDRISEFILVTNRSMGFPSSINGKPCYVVNLGLAWL
jgi:hypothetical protein